VGALELRALEAGPQDGPLALCLHGFPDTPHTWRHLLPALGRAGWRALAPWMRGYTPQSIPEDGAYSIADLAGDALGLIEAVGAGPAALVGHDWGATAATGAAILAPEHVARLVTLAVPHRRLGVALATDYEQQKRSWYMFFFQMPFAEAVVAAHDFAFLRRLWSDWSPGYAPEPEEWQAIVETFHAPGVLSAALGYYRAGLGPASGPPERVAAQARATTENVPVETLHLHGRRDGCVAASLNEGLEEAYPKGLRLELIPDAGHFLHLEQPERVNRLIVDFLGRPA
jgi:pimeloyl-ACP methyl ester carboxylesterase